MAVAFVASVSGDSGPEPDFAVEVPIAGVSAGSRPAEVLETKPFVGELSPGFPVIGHKLLRTQ